MAMYERIMERDAVAAFNAAVEIVPLIDPAYRRIRRIVFLEVRNGLAERDFAQQRKCAIEDAVPRSGDHDGG